MSDLTREQIEALEQDKQDMRHIAHRADILWTDREELKAQLAAMTTKLDELNAKVAAMTWERDEAERREKEWELDYSRDLKAVIKERDDLNNVLRHAGWGQGEIDSAAYTFDKLATANAGLVYERDRLKEALEYYAQTAISARAVAALRGETGGA